MTHSRQHRPEIVVGLVATPPDHPAQVVARLTAELSDRPADRMNADLQWTVRQGWGDVAPRRDGGAEALLEDLASLEDLARRRDDEGWDVAVCLTDLPLHADPVPLVAQSSARRRVALVSLPALGLRQLRGDENRVTGSELTGAHALCDQMPTCPFAAPRRWPVGPARRSDAAS